MKSVMPLLAESTGDGSAQVVLVVAIIGAIGAIIASALGGAFSSWFARQQERQAIAAAFAGEIQSTVEATNWRHARKAIAQGKAVPVAEHSFPIFEANVAKIGFLPVDLAAKDAVYYSDLGGVFLDFRTLHTTLVKREIYILNADQISCKIWMLWR